MAKEFNAETATLDEGIVATFEFEIENACDDEKRKKEITLNIVREGPPSRGRGRGVPEGRERSR